MNTLLIAVASFVGFIVAYHTYGRWLASKIFGLDSEAVVPSQEMRDDIDYVPTKREIIFGHHFTSIAGTGPIVGPAIAVFWGWLPALLWVILGSIFIGAVHDFGALVISMRNRGQTVGDIAGRMITPRAKIFFLLVLFMSLTIVLAIFGLVIALIFALYPESVLSVWIEIPLAISIGIWIHRKGKSLLIPSVLALGVMYISMAVGAYILPIDLSRLFGLPLVGQTLANVVVVWTMILFVYCFIASVLPVWTLLQPRDYINSHELIVALGLLILGLVIAGVTGKADLFASAPAVANKIPIDAPPIMPFLFITIACGAISGFHCLVSSGTSSKQIESEADAQYVGYGAMLLEGGLAVVVILACCAGIGMGLFEKSGTGARYAFTPVLDQSTGKQISGRLAWESRYSAEISQIDGKIVGGWKNHSLGKKVSAFIDGGGNFLSVIGIPLKMGITIMAVLVASFAATTLDSATRLQRYVIQELGQTLSLSFVTNRYVSTAIALILGGAVALLPGPSGPGSGGMILWPLFGATNQLLAGLAFMVILFYLIRRNKPVWFVALPMLAMIIMPTWAMMHNIFNPETGWWISQKYLLVGFGLGIQFLQFWILVEGLTALKNAKGNYPELPPVEKGQAQVVS
tara:strand:- start:1272 stop:3164 length:1893 start_codon:yes stop_codon:yes gene_type:complete